MKTIHITCHLQDEFLQAILKTAVKNIGHWAKAQEYEKDLYELTYCYEDSDIADFEPQALSLYTIAIGMQKALQVSQTLMGRNICSHRFQSRIFLAIRETDPTYIDPSCADAIVQIGLFEEIIYK